MLFSRSCYIIIEHGSQRRRCDEIGRRSGLKIHRWQQRAGSSPATGTNLSPAASCPQRQYADVAHLVERDLAKVEVASSSLVIRSNKGRKLMACVLFRFAARRTNQLRCGMRHSRRHHNICSCIITSDSLHIGTSITNIRTAAELCSAAVFLTL